MLGTQMIKKLTLMTFSVAFLCNSNMQAMDWFRARRIEGPILPVVVPVDAPAEDAVALFRGVINDSGIVMRQRTWQGIRNGSVFGGCIAGRTALIFSADLERAVKAGAVGVLFGGVFGWHSASCETAGIALTQQLAQAQEAEALRRREHDSTVNRRLAAIERINDDLHHEVANDNGAIAQRFNAAEAAAGDREEALRRHADRRFNEARDERMAIVGRADTQFELLRLDIAEIPANIIAELQRVNALAAAGAQGQRRALVDYQDDDDEID